MNNTLDAQPDRYDILCTQRVKAWSRLCTSTGPTKPLMIVYVINNTRDAQPDRYNIFLYTTSEGMVEIHEQAQPNP